MFKKNKLVDANLFHFLFYTSFESNKKKNLNNFNNVL